MRKEKEEMQDWKSACCADSDQGKSTTSDATLFTRVNNTSPSPSMQGGNRCGHNKKVFRLPVYANVHKRRYHVLEEAKRRLRQAQKYPYRYPELTPVFFHKEKRGRKRRSEAVEAITSLVLDALIEGANLVNYLAYGYYDSQNNFHAYGYEYLCKVTKCTYGRVQRALSVLKSLGLCKVEGNVVALEDGSYTTQDVKVSLTPDVFIFLGLENELNKDTQLAFIKWEKKQLGLAKKYNIKILKKEKVSANFLSPQSLNFRTGLSSIQTLLNFTVQKPNTKPPPR